MNSMEIKNQVYLQVSNLNGICLFAGKLRCENLELPTAEDSSCMSKLLLHTKTEKKTFKTITVIQLISSHRHVCLFVARLLIQTLYL